MEHSDHDQPSLQVLAELSPDIVDALDAWILMLPEPQPSRAAAVDLALRDWLTMLGLLPFHDDPEQAN